MAGPAIPLNVRRLKTMKQQVLQKQRDVATDRQKITGQKTAISAQYGAHPWQKYHYDLIQQLASARQ
jgi:hypothetical protein